MGITEKNYRCKIGTIRPGLLQNLPNTDTGEHHAQPNPKREKGKSPIS